MLDKWRQARQAIKHHWQLFREPHLPEREEAIQRVGEALPEYVKTPIQALGAHASGCTATYNIMEKCNFSCTACYLSKEANHTPPLPYEEVCEQIDEIRQYIGPGGNIQLTAGEVTLMPVEDLTKLVKYCVDNELSPMVMSHGDTFREDPDYLEHMMIHGGLEKVAIHVDTTQRGRIGQKKGDTEQDLNWLRDEFADMIRQARAKTGQTLHAAHNYTIDETNLDAVPDVMRWGLENSDAFRLMSFQPTAAVGRTRTGHITGRRELVWSKICEGVGAKLNRHTFMFGHPDCTFLALMFVVKFDGEMHVVEVSRDNEPLDRLFIQRFAHGSLGGIVTDNMTFSEQIVMSAGRLAQEPRTVLEVLGYCGYRAWTEREWLPRLIGAMAAGRQWSINPFAIVVHNFMSADELDTPTGQERLAACAFRLPVEGEMIPMCQMNGTDMRRELNLKAKLRLAAKRAKQKAA